MTTERVQAEVVAMVALVPGMARSAPLPANPWDAMAEILNAQADAEQQPDHSHKPVA